VSYAVVLGNLLLLASLASPSANAASRFWDGSANGNFSAAANWVGGVAPVAGDDLVLQSGVTRLLVTNDFSPNRAFNSVLFQGSNYFVRGNALLVTNGISSINPVGPNHIDADVDARASQAWEAQGSLASLDINGDINLNANTLTVRANTGDFFFSGIVHGAGNLVKTNVGTLRLDGAGHNTYAGFTRLDGGVLELDKFSIFPTLTNFTAIPGDLTIGDGNGLVATDFLRLLADEQIADTSDVTVRNSGVFDLNDHDERIGTLTLQGGTVDSGAGTLFLGGNVSTMSDGNTALINGHLSLGGASRTFNVASGPALADLRINALISGDPTGVLSSPGITKAGPGTLFLAGTNTYNGTTTINDGQVALLNDRALGATFNVLGAAGTIVNGTANLFLSGVQVTNEALTINSDNPGGAFNASGPSVWTGNIVLNTDTFIASSGTLLLSGAITGAGGFTKLGLGSVTLAGTNANTYTGTTTVRDGALFLDKDPALVGGAMSGPLVIGENELPVNTDVVQFLAAVQLPDDTDVTLNTSGLLDLNGFGQNVRNLIFNGGGNIDAPAPGSLLAIGDITVNPTTNALAVISGRMSVLSNPIINITTHAISPDLRISAVLFGAGGFTKNGVGELSLTAANSYTGLTTVNGGFLEVDNSLALGSTANGTVVHSGAVLALRFDSHVPAEDLTLAGTGRLGFGALSSSFGSNSWAGDITLSSNATISVDVGDFLNLSGAISGGADLTKTGTGILLFSGGTANSFGGLFMNAGTLLLAKSIANAAGPADLTVGDGSGSDVVRLLNDNQIADATEVHVTRSGLFDLNDMVETTGAIDGSGRIDLGNGVLRAGANNASSTFTGLIVGTGNLFKFGTGNWTLTGDNAYSGQTTVSAGVLQVDGSQPQSPVAVNGTAFLTGDGAVGALQAFGSVAPGGVGGPAILTCSNLAFSAAGDFFVDLNGSVPGTGFDQLNVRGTNALGGATLHLSVGPDFAPVEGERLTILQNDGSEAIVGTFGGLPNGSLLHAGGHDFRILYSDIFLNDVVLVVTNTALQLAAAPTASTGNGNDEIEPGECNLLRITLANKLAGIVSGVRATLSCSNPDVTITQPFSTYPNLPPNGVRANDTPFQISTSPAMVCGTNLLCTLTVHTATNGSFSVPFRLFTGTAGSVRRFNRTGDQAIPDLGTLDSTILVAGMTVPTHHVVVSLHLSHTVDDNLHLTLEDPDGQSIDLSSDNGGTFDDYGTSCADADRTTFSDAASVPITAGSAPFRGTFRPEQLLSTYRGKFGPSVNGVWHLRISDDTAGGIGTLHCWSLEIFPTACEPGGGECEQCGGPMVGAITGGDATQNNRFLRQGAPSECGSVKACPPESTGAIIHYDPYTFTNAGPPTCVTVALNTPCDGEPAPQRGLSRQL
jgi:autotransporter-associated beta strand protein